jgi:hypothetical protein
MTDLLDATQLAGMPLGRLMHTAAELDYPGLVPLRAIEEAAGIQRELMIVAGILRDLEARDGLASRLTPQGRGALRRAAIEDFIAPYGTILRRFAAAYLDDPDCDLSTDLFLALMQQTADVVPAEVPSMAILLSSPAAALGADGGALFDREIVRAGLIVSSSLRALYPSSQPSDLLRKPERDTVSVAPRPKPARARGGASLDLGFAVRSAQQLEREIAAAGVTPDAATHSVLLGYLQLAERRFRRDGYVSFATLLSELRLRPLTKNRTGSPARFYASL